MTSKLKTLVGTTSVLALLMSGAPAMATGTLAGASIENTVAVTFEVGGVTQTATGDTNDFVVDRKIIFDVNATDATSTVVAPGSTDNVLTFTLENTSNDTLDFTVAIAENANGVATSNADAGNDNYNTSGTIYYCVDNNGNAVCDAGEENVNINNLAPDTSRLIWVYGDFPLNAPNGSVAGVTITTVALDSSGAALTNDSGTADDTTAVQNVFADTGNNNSEAADDNYLVAAAVLAVSKLSRVVSDPVSGTTNPKAIPGAVVEYCISVANTGAGTATNVLVADNLLQAGQTNTTFDATFTPKKNGTTITGSTCSVAGAVDVSSPDVWTASEVSATLADVASGETRTLVFRVTID